MPLVRIDVVAPWSEAELGRLGAAVQDSLVETLDVPERDRFQVITVHEPGRLAFSRDYLDIPRSARFVLVEVTVSAGRTTEAKAAFYRRLAERLASDVGLAPEDLAICLVENRREDWSFGRGEASYVVLPPERWR